MDTFTLRYQHNPDPDRGLATAGIFLIKAVLALPHMMVVGALQTLSNILAYIGFWVVAFTGEMPQAVHRLIEISFGWSARTFGWLIGFTDKYPPFETDPEYPVAFPITKPADPSKRWAVAGLLVVPKALAIIPHLIVIGVLTVAAVFALWAGYIVAAFTGRLPEGIQDFLAGYMQWGFRVEAWIAGFTDEYPPFSLDARPSA